MLVQTTIFVMLLLRSNVSKNGLVPAEEMLRVTGRGLSKFIRDNKLARIPKTGSQHDGRWNDTSRTKWIKVVCPDNFSITRVEDSYGGWL